MSSSSSNTQRSRKLSNRFSNRASASAGSSNQSQFGKRLNMSVECLESPQIPTHSKRRRKQHLKTSRQDEEETSTSEEDEFSIARSRSRGTDTSISKSSKHNKLQHKLRNLVLDTDPNQIRQELRKAQNKNLKLEEKLELKSAELIGIKRRETELKERERELFSQLRDAHDQIKDVEEERDTIRVRQREIKRDLKNARGKVNEKERDLKNAISNLKDKNHQIKLLEERLSESTELLGSNLNAMKHRKHSKGPSDSPCASTSSPGMNDAQKPSSDGNIFDDMMSNFKDMLENELQCSICNEVYVFPQTVECGHTYCEHCIRSWMNKKMNCPECRAKISKPIPNKVLDSYIAKFVESFVPKQFQDARKSLVEERRNKMLEQNERSPRNFRIRNRIESDQDDSPASPGPIVVTDTESSSSSDTSDDINSISSDDSSQHLNAIFRTNGSDLNIDSDDSSFIDWQL